MRGRTGEAISSNTTSAAPFTAPQSSRFHRIHFILFIEFSACQARFHESKRNMHVGISMTHIYIPYTEENRKRSI